MPKAGGRGKMDLVHIQAISNIFKNQNRHTTFKIVVKLEKGLIRMMDDVLLAATEVRRKVQENNACIIEKNIYCSERRCLREGRGIILIKTKQS